MWQKIMLIDIKSKILIIKYLTGLVRFKIKNTISSSVILRMLIKQNSQTKNYSA